MTIDDIEIIDDKERLRMFLHIRKSKTDQEGRGQKIAIPEGKKIKPIKYLQDWLGAAGILSGPVFQTMIRGGRLRGKQMHHSDVPRIVKHYAAQHWLGRFRDCRAFVASGLCNQRGGTWRAD